MKIALDIDGTISERPDFFAVLSVGFRAAGHEIVILTYRDPNREQAMRDELTGWGIEFDQLVIAPSLEAKGKLCGTLGVDVFFDDQDECLVNVPESVLVVKVRNGGNFDFEEHLWLSTAKLTKLLR
ncbi:MAG: hypothetical protein ACFCD0_25645 [Gemmataceae bacterium]